MELTRELLDHICDIAVAAGQKTLPIYNSNFEIETKDDDSPLTQADLAAHVSIKQALSELTPDTPQLSEEGADIDFDTRRSWSTYWLIDPLDGTKEFVNKNDQFTINIALIVDHEPVLGVVYAPVLDTLWFAAREIGAFRQQGAANPEPIAAVAAHTNKPRVLVSRSHRSASIDALLANLPDYEPITMGSSLKFCVIADGDADFYPRLGPTSEWDTAAGHAVLACAGGQVTDLDGEPLRYNVTESVLNTHFLAFGDTGHDWRAYLPDASK
ncbi:Inositol monophosphatase family protein [Salinisphaera shabanensis E1L3A]|uniref:3'(2'),5'-bisphosphate nucleotidase CysQ n=1 Tax=Salinisphaera shabanensis E1L3A TaxID=1033802 RepID=U2EHL1_9GAMM|nr:3'(2'),5'-bisphosphate nucleotidase CysQ [Salinisphaera shabanensis]ERJ17872.1 Inositol monophosphatase family protein [Salinisphaera shabanensis E1L3A]